MQLLQLYMLVSHLDTVGTTYFGSLQLSYSYLVLIIASIAQPYVPWRRAVETLEQREE